MTKGTPINTNSAGPSAVLDPRSRILAHRGLWTTPDDQNTEACLIAALAAGYGIETDLRDHDGRLVISHDPAGSHSLDALAFARSAASALAGGSGPLALNIKSDGLIPLLGPLLDLLPRHRVFFFDMTTPQLISYARARLPVAIRVSEFEPVDHSLFANLGVPVQVWLDAFDTEWWLGDPVVEAICRAGQVAIVSPEIHGRDPEATW